MFPGEAIPVSYYEEREKQDAAKRLARLAEQQAKAQAAATMSSSSSTQQSAPQSLLTQPVAKPTSSSVLGNIFQGFVKAASSPSPPASIKGGTSGSNTPVQTPPAKVMTQAEIEAMMERRKDNDIAAFRAW